jgi:benzaldehyde dehydrogenase (NAD)
MATYEQSLLIGGQWMPADSGKTYECVNPFTGKATTRAAAASVSDVARAVGAAQDAFGAWAALPPSKRRQYMLAAADAIEARLPEFSEAVTSEMGGPAAMGLYNVNSLAERFRFAAGVAFDGLTGEVIPSKNPRRTMIAIRKPLGVVMGIVPWNVSALPVGNSVPDALVLGNTVVIKASEQMPRTHGLVAACFVEAGLPAGVVNLITNAPENAPQVVEALIAHKHVRLIHFTGSTRIGRIIAEQAGKHLKRAILELGGNAPFIVLADADLDLAVRAAAFGSFVNSGQGCVCTERVIVDKSIADEFCRRLAAVAKKTIYGDLRDSNTQLGPVINGAAATRLEAMVGDACSGSAKVLAGGKAEGPCFEPTVLSNVTSAMRLYREESFGPIVSVTAADGPEDALRLANDSDYGLSSAIFTRDITLALDLDGLAKSSGYNLRAKVEASIRRYKQVIGDALRSRTDRTEATEVAVAAAALNRMLEFGRPNYVRIA